MLLTQRRMYYCILYIIYYYIIIRYYYYNILICSLYNYVIAVVNDENEDILCYILRLTTNMYVNVR